MTTDYQPTYTNQYENYLTHTMSAKTNDIFAMPVNPYLMGNWGDAMPIPLGAWI